MKTLLKIAIGIGSLVGLILIIALLFPNEVEVERSIVIKAQPKKVFNQVNDLKNWANWMPWTQADSSITITHGEKTIGEDANYSWESKLNEGGNITIVSSEENRIITKIAFGKTEESLSIWDFKDTKEGVFVTWKLSFELDYPFTIFGGMIESAIAPDIEKGLSNLKEFTSREPK